MKKKLVGKLKNETKMKPLILIIMDGWGIRKKREGNAVALARTPNFDRLKKKYPYNELKAAGKAVGLMKGMMGNSETGHLNIGAGRIVPEDVVRINKSISNKSFFKNRAFLRAIENVKRKNSTLHLMGLLSDAGVHSLDLHLYALLKLVTQHKLKKVMIHLFTDGRDTPIKSAKKYLKKLEKEIKKYKTGKIATIIGRYYAMDRDNRWQRTEKAYFCLAKAKGVKVKTALEGIRKAYQKGETDEFLKPIVVADFQGIKNDDSVIFFNYRPDRSRQLVKAFLEPRFNKFKRGQKLKLKFVCMTKYYKEIEALIAFEHFKLKNIFGEVISKKGISQLRIAETEKYSHVTFFFNALREKPFPKEDRILIPSPKVATYDLKPEMSANKVTKAVIKAIKSEKYKVIILNFANPDMVGHTGNLKAAIFAIETVDKCLGRVVKAIQDQKGIAIITADHGNAEYMIDPKTKEALSEHSTNPVPLIIVSDKNYALKKGKLADIAPTMLKILGIKKPKEMTGICLI